MRINKKKFITRMFILFSIIGLLIYARYFSVNEEHRNYVINYYKDFINSFKNNSTYLVAEKAFSIENDKTLKNTIISRDSGLLVVNSNGVKEYDFSETPTWSKEFNISNPIIASKGNWLIVAEENGAKVIAFNGKEEVYNILIEGNIQKIVTNGNGYLGVIFAKVGYKNAFAFINPEGKLIYTKYFANTTLIDADINSAGNKIVMIEADTTGAVINSAITYLDNKANILHSIIKKNTLLVEAHFIGDETIIIGDNIITKINSDYKEEIIEKIEKEKVIGTLVKDEKIIKIYRNTEELFSGKTMIEIKNINGKVVGQGEVEGTAQSLDIQNKTVAVVLTDRIDFLNSKGNYMDSIFISSDYRDVKLFQKGSAACIQTMDEIIVYKVK